ncbi:MAG TPA: energy transducer TonB [Thermoanaerobaculia bacterium]|nr:energy transducer TonB [Thermoanaerobaculia bacterium]
MDLQKELLESSRGKSDKRSLRASVVSLVLHGVLVAGIVYAGAQNVTHKVDAEKPINAFLTRGAAPPPPPPPPPPPAKSSGAPKSVTPKTAEIPKPMTSSVLTPPVEIPTEVPKTDSIPTPTQNLPVAETPVEPEGGALDTGAGDALAGVAGGVEGGVAGGVVGGELGGVQGGELGGVAGGQLGGTLGGQVGGTGTGTEGTGTGGDDAPPEPAPDGPLRVGGNVKAPVVVDRADPVYTETARKARIQGVVIVEAIIDKQGNVDNVKIVKGLPGGLSEEAMKAVRKWKFRPGTMGGEPVATIFNLTVNFQMNGGT